MGIPQRMCDVIGDVNMCWPGIFISLSLISIVPAHLLKSQCDCPMGILLIVEITY